MATEICPDCGKEYGIGEWPICPHGKPHGDIDSLAEYIDENIAEQPVLITSRGQRRRLMRAAGFEFKDKMSPGAQSARIDKVMEVRKEQEYRRRHAH